ncbi:uncharacterized protein LOC121885667 [Thunnus maccoyii]|uniref:uncharacterized protein LOC121885667 n=1 Tax=Thunnus maccoyii TaxID=8240 RepID=UPI001C4C3697|nr:uncharacterized protein LOC121885667 [Thunnus maccoyii]
MLVLHFSHWTLVLHSSHQSPVLYSKCRMLIQQPAVTCSRIFWYHLPFLTSSLVTDLLSSPVFVADLHSSPAYVVDFQSSPAYVAGLQVILQSSSTCLVILMLILQSGSTCLVFLLPVLHSCSAYVASIQAVVQSYSMAELFCPSFLPHGCPPDLSFWSCILVTLQICYVYWPCPQAIRLRFPALLLSKWPRSFVPLSDHCSYHVAFCQCF